MPGAADRLTHMDYDAIFGQKANWALVEKSDSSEMLFSEGE